MARKDTIKALVSRDISEETANLLLTKYSSLKAISDAGVPALLELGISEEEANDVISKIGKRASRASAPAKVKDEAVEEIVVERMEPVHKQRVFSAEEQELIDICNSKTDDDGESYSTIIPAKIIIDIAARIKDHDVSDEKKEELLDVAARMCKSHRMDYNESVGVMAAHSIGEPGTQMNMRTFHYAGVANINVTQGLPRLIEIVDARRVPSTPSMTIPLLPEVDGSQMDEGIAKRISYEIEMTKLEDIVSIETDITNMRLIVTPDQRKMDDRGITLEDIVDKLNKVKVLRGLAEIEDYKIVITSDAADYKKLQQIYDAAKVAKIKGIDNIEKAVISKQNGGIDIVTEGSNLKEVLKVKGVDWPRVKTNSILEVADVLGVEAARNSIINEAYGTLSDAGLDVDIRHIMLVADMMTNDGDVRAIGRHGISGKKASVLARAAFEITTPHLLHAAMNGEIDHLEGVAENIIVGQPVTLGTGAVNLEYEPKIKPKEGDEQ